MGRRSTAMIGASLTHRAHRVGEGPRLLLRDVVSRADHHPVLPGAAEQIRPPAAVSCHTAKRMVVSCRHWDALIR